MNVQPYIETLQDFTVSPRDAFNTYDKQYPNIAKFEYFRTKYNNKRKELNIAVPVPTTQERPSVHNHSKLELEVNNYKGADLTSLISEVIPTGTLFDEIISDGGFVRKSVDAVAAKAGSGKTWSRMSLAAEAVLLNKKLIKEQEDFIDNYPEETVVMIKPIKAALLSAEMVEHEIAKEVRSSPKLENIDFIYLVNYFRKGITADQYWDILEQCFKNYDLLIADSFSVIFEQLFELYEGRMKAKKLLFLLIDRITKYTEKYNCNLQLILQCKRDGTYLGASALVHAISSLSYVHVYGQKRFIMFEKNRNNGSTVNQEVFFSKKEGSIEFDEEAYKNTYRVVEDKKSSMADFIKQLQDKNAPKIEAKSGEEAVQNQTDLLSQIAEMEENNSIEKEPVTENTDISPQLV